MQRRTRVVAWGLTSIFWTTAAWADEGTEEPVIDIQPVEDARDEVEPGAAEADSLAEADAALDAARAAVKRAEQALTKAQADHEEAEEEDGEGDQDVAVTPDDPELDDARALLIVWRGLRGKSLTSRISALEDYVRDHPHSRYAAVMWEEAQALRDLRKRRLKDQGKSVPDGRIRSRGLALPDRVATGRAFDVVIELDGEPAGGVRIRVATDRLGPFSSHHMRRLSARHWSYRVSADLVQAPGVALYVETIDEDDEVHQVVGSDMAPRFVEVKDAAEIEAEEGLVVTGWSKVELVDVNKFRGDDYNWRIWGAGEVRFGPVGLRRAALGYTLHRIVTADSDWLRRELPPYAAGFGAGFVELELAPDPLFSFVGRVLVGRQGEEAAGGFRGGMRIGHDVGTNVLVACEGIVGWGVRGIAQLEIQEAPDVPVTLRFEVSNQGSAPAPFPEIASGLWGRGILEVGYRFVPAFEASARVSIQGRAEEHAGAGIGGGVKVRW